MGEETTRSGVGETMLVGELVTSAIATAMANCQLPMHEMMGRGETSVDGEGEDG